MGQLSSNEEWRVCPIDPLMMVSNLGRVRSTDRLVNTVHGAKRMVRGKVLKPVVLTTGYLQIHGSDRKQRAVHRMVASAFLEVTPERNVVNHKNGIRTDNRVENLEWVTNSENLKHAYRELGVVNPFTEKTGAQHPTSKPVIATEMNSGLETRYDCALDAVRAIGADSGLISRACNGKINHHKGHYWRFA
jgi:hypothetical protein